MGSGGSGNHPVEVVGRIREQPDPKSCPAALSAVGNGSCVRVKTDQGYRDFLLDGVSFSAHEKLAAFYARYVESRVDDVRCGGRCTIMMYGPTGAGKSHTMFGSAKEPGVAYLALHHVMSKTAAQEVSANVLEIYNEDVYDLLAGGNTPLSSPGPRCAKSISGRPKLEVRGKKVRNATSISSIDPTKLVQEIARVEKRRVVKSTNSNDRSSRSHCMVVLNILGVGGRLVLVDMAGSENSEQAGSEAKIQTGRINQGNSALKRVVECIANGNPYIPYRDSKLTMLLQDSFEVDGSKILMVLCASPDPRDVYKTICTLEYGAKAKCIVRLPTSPPRDGSSQNSSEAALQARLEFKDECLERLRADYEQKVKDHEEEMEKLADREMELSNLRTNLERVEAEWSGKMAEFRKEMGRAMELKSQELRTALELEVRERTPGLDVGSSSEQERLTELERVVEDQKQEIGRLRLRAETAEAELVRLQQSTRMVAKSRERAEEGLLCLDTKQLTQVSAVESLNSWASHAASPRLLSCAADNGPPSSAQTNADFNFSCAFQQKASSCGQATCPASPTSPTDSASPSAAAARRARIENIFQLCGDGRERCKTANSPKPPKPPGNKSSRPLRAVENQTAAVSPPPPCKLRRHGENLAPFL
ncbi:kinesin-like protein KIN-10A [Selaginella moellendorffii]|uniref:kinesin-like protein KIN-10A n=1 Tax=Selaginella moellendorffii TaxID=88036 RepID=UPI000D1C2B58|nr:kinesin-like protein KIN-10A [Selaginella moellendorffii]|eukprot:XP_024518749.1 kinesin-like protein KIN-10A [Selaginella moellendorffii]